MKEDSNSNNVFQTNLDDRGVLKIQAYSNNIIRVQINLDSDLIDSPSALIPNDNIPFKTIIKKKKDDVNEGMIFEGYELETYHIKIKVKKDPLMLEFIDMDDGYVFMKDIPNQAYRKNYNIIRHSVVRYQKNSNY